MAGKIGTHKVKSVGQVHGRDRHYISAHASQAMHIRNSHRWHRFRAWYRKRYPVCVDPFNDHAEVVTPTAHVHHIKPLAAYPSLAFKPWNCAALCRPCHDKVEANESRGVSTAHLFDCE